MPNCNASQEILSLLHGYEQVYNNSLAQTVLKNDLERVGLNRQAYQTSITCGLVGGFLAAIVACVVHIPSYISTVLKFRSGVIPSLHDRDFLRYRFAPDVVTVLFGSVFWGALATAISAGLIVTVFVSFGLFLPLSMLLIARVSQEKQKPLSSSSSSSSSMNHFLDTGEYIGWCLLLNRWFGGQGVWSSYGIHFGIGHQVGSVAFPS